MRRIKTLLGLFVLVGIVCLIAGCAKETVPDLQEFENINTSQLAARIDGREIRLEELDAALSLILFDIEEQKHEIRIQQLYELAEFKSEVGVQKEKVEILLKVPEPPRINLPIESLHPRGNAKAPITVATFCSFQSPHCKHLQPIIRRLTEDYAGWVRQVNFDFPLKFHRQGIKAASAARCAADQDRFWEYHDALYVESPKFGVNTYTRLAKQLQLDIEQFELCLSEGHHKRLVLDDRDRAVGLGLQNVPVVFINGLYLKGPRKFEQYAFWIEKELRLLGVNSGEKYIWLGGEDTDDRNLPITSLPLRLLGVSVSTNESRSKALIEVAGEGAQYFVTGQELIKDVSLLRLHSNFAVIESGVGLEKLLLKGKEGTGILLTHSRGHNKALKQRIEQPMGPGTRTLTAPTGVLTLGHDWLSKQLEQREILEAKFTVAELEVEGHHLMRLEGVADNEFFSALGFQENDVLLRVNDSWVHSGQNSLWDALGSGQVIDVTFMRKGLPHRLQYVVDELNDFENSSEGE
ncbi:thioredoxin domain-containing protein [Microbulbifer sp. OS29]|uniref:Thioredoxin domain-containing protein n=1 Tax=Microbulbifer okhotskensis TaxID=2926617 RepID=A0A9X2EPL9_9GAMM|nr:thioredoxin domain-containing protein [Microbulbifer okhotskensis]MCO1335501.1 thioredoxin domain-containing protein [Microbulbifer okhotskensis]